MSNEHWQEVSKSKPCPACGKPDWCAWTPDGKRLKCERISTPPDGMVKVKDFDGGALFKYPEATIARMPKWNRPCSNAKSKMIFATAEDAIGAAGIKAKGAFVAAWTYPGNTYRVVRFALTNGKKTFRPIHRNDKGWLLGDPDGLLPLYRGDSIIDGEPVFVVEGEKCADAAASIGLVAVTSAHGGGSARKSYWRPLAGREVVILPDNDDTGRKYAQDVATILNELTPPARVKVVELPDLAVGGDIADWIDAVGPIGDKDADTIKAAVLELAKAAEISIPAVAPVPTVSPVEPYLPFPVDCLPEPMRSFVAQAAEAIGCDPVFVALPLITAAASAIGNTRCIELKREWTEPAVLWSAIVGDSGTLKSPALELALRFVRRRQENAMQEYRKALAAHKDEVIRFKKNCTTWQKSGEQDPLPTEPQAPVQQRCWCSDTTVEALVTLLQDNWRGLLMCSDELSGWIAGFDRYVKANGGDVAKWLEMFGGRSVMVDRKTGNPRTIYIHRAAVSITGGIQPDTLRRALGRQHFENGLAARLLLASPPRRVKKWNDNEIDAETEAALHKVFDHLYSLEPVLGQDGQPEPCIVRLSESAKAAWISFYDEHARQQVALSGDLSAAWSKLEGYAARLALVVHCARMAAKDSALVDDNVVDDKSIAAGVAMSRWFGQETRRIYSTLSENDLDRQRRALIELVQRLGGCVTIRDIMRHSRAYKMSDVAEQALAGLVRDGLGHWEDVEAKPQGGRPTRQFRLT